MNVAREAIKLLQEKGWIQGTLESEDGYCIIGAMREVSIANPLLRNQQTIYQYRDALFLLQSRVGPYPPEWNDHRNRNVDEVIGVLKLVAEEIDLEKEKA